ncbi:MAG: hypothetical protein M3Q85_11160, partial [Acidobacteriota bacterium]|nr:hypothetical protein [Acidobacteriota bacterium]
SYDAETTLGDTRVVLVLRKVSSAWRLLAAARDPITTGQFVKELPSAVAGLARRERNAAVPAPAIFWSPGAGTYPRPAQGQRFGDFTWHSSSSEDVILEIAKFGYQCDARLVMRRPAGAQSRSRISAGQLWTTRGEWTWRVWSISTAGDVAFSSSWTFVH